MVECRVTVSDHDMSQDPDLIPEPVMRPFILRKTTNANFLLRPSST